MLPKEKIEQIIAKHGDIEKELSSGNINSKTFAQKSKEYSELNTIIKYAKDYLKIDIDRKDSEQILNDKSSDKEMKALAEKELLFLKEKKFNVKIN